MSMTTEEMNKFIMDMNTLLGHFKMTAEKIAKESFENMKRLEQTLRETKEEMAQLRQEMRVEIREETKKAVKEALEEQTAIFEKRLKFATNDIEEMVRLLFKERKETAQQTRILSWKAVGGLGAAMAAMVIASGVYVENRYQALQKIKVEDAQTEYSLRAKKTLDQMTVRNCKGKVCVKVDPNEKPYGNEGEEYRVVAE